MIASALVLSACGGSKLFDTSGAATEKPGEQKKVRGLEAPLLSKGGSSAQGKISIYQKDDRWQLSATMFSLPPGASYRVAFFDNGNCSSPNAFSAGKLWLPPDAPEGTRSDKWIPLFYSGVNGSLDAVTRLPNPGRHSEEAFRGRSVLVFADDRVQELKPGVPNNVVACGVFDTIQALF
jgi:Cu/Zn superoxide dismutase